MNRKPNHTDLLSRLMVLLMLLSVINPALAAYTKTITIDPGVTVYMDDVRLMPKDANGNPVEVFAYNGTTYLPARAISEALDIPIQWDGATASVYIGKHTGSTPAAYLSDLDYFDQSGKWTVGTTEKDNLGKEHTHCLQSDSTLQDGPIERAYRINGKYSTLSGTLFQQYDYRGADEFDGAVLSIYGDEELLWTGRVQSGIEPVDFSINITGIQILKFTLSCLSGSYYSDYCGAIGDVGLWT